MEYLVLSVFFVLTVFMVLPFTANSMNNAFLAAATYPGECPPGENQTGEGTGGSGAGAETGAGANFNCIEDLELL